MCKKMTYFVSFVLVLAVTGTASADQQAITVPNGDFEEIYKPGSDTITADLGDGWTNGVGPDTPMDGAQIATYSDGTTGTLVDVPGWIGAEGWENSYDWDPAFPNRKGSIARQTTPPDGLYYYTVNGGDWGNAQGGAIVSDAPLATVESGLTYTLSMLGNGSVTPVVLDLLADGVPLTPSSSVQPDSPYAWDEFSRTYDAATLDGFVGQALTIRLGVGPDASGTQSHFDAVSLSYEPAAPTMVPITIDNPGFEDPILAEDDWTWGDVPGWTLVGGEATDTEGSGVWNVTLGDFDPVIAPEGENVLYTEYLPEGIAKGVAQVLTETFAANTDYTLTVEVGNSNYYYNAGYSVQLLAGGVVIAEDNDTLWPDYKKWATSTVAYTYDPADSALVGQPLEIRLLNLELDKDSPPAGEVVGVEFDNVTLSYVVWNDVNVATVAELEAAAAAANPGDRINLAAGMYYLTSQIEIKSGVTYMGAGADLTIIDGNDLTRAFVAWGDRGAADGQVDANGISVPNATGPKGWVLEGMTIQNCVADTNNRFSYTSAAFNLKTDFATLDADASGGLNPDEADGEVGGIRLAGADGTEGTEDDDLHRFAHIDTDGSGELSEAELDAQILVQEDEFGDEDGDGGAITIHNEAVGTIQNCDFLNNHTPIAGDGDDGGAVNIASRSTITINDCLFNGNYACSPSSVAESDETGNADGDGGHIKVQGNNLTNGFINIGTTLIANRCVFLNGNAEDDGGAIQAAAQGVVVRLDSCWFEGNTSWDNGTVLAFQNEDQHEVTVTNCVFANNITKADNSPDRMIETRRNSKFVNCTFVGNIQEDQDLIYNNANKADGDHDGVDDELADATQVVNCIFANNVVGNGDDVLGSRNNDFTIAATNCLFFGNTLQNGNAADNTQRPDVETGSVLTDPLLDAEYVPIAGSPAIDAGTAAGAPDHDFDGAPRPQGAAHDIGAYEAPAN